MVEEDMDAVREAAELLDFAEFSTMEEVKQANAHKNAVKSNGKHDAAASSGEEDKNNGHGHAEVVDRGPVPGSGPAANGEDTEVTYQYGE